MTRSSGLPLVWLLAWLVLTCWTIAGHAQQSGEAKLGTPITSLPYTISSPGVYVLTQDFLALNLANGPAIQISASDVVLDLSGHTIDNTAAGTGTTAYGVLATDQTNVAVRNGTIQGFMTGVAVTATDLNNPAATSYGHLVEKLDVNACTYEGISVAGADSTVRSCQVENIGGSSVLDQLASAYGIDFLGTGMRCLDCDVSAVTASGTDGVSYAIYLDSTADAFVVNNRMSAVQYGVYFGNGATGKYRDNLSTGILAQGYSGGTDAGNNYPSVITSADIAAGEIGVTFGYQLTATNNPTTYNASGLPDGLAINTQTGLISGTPTSTGTYNVSLVAITSKDTATGTLNLTITTAGAPVIVGSLALNTHVNATFTYQITASNNPTVYSAYGLPLGLSLNTQSGLISGTPIEVGNFNVNLHATNAIGTGTATLNTVVEPALPVISSANSVSGQVNAAFSYQIMASSVPTSFRAAGLPTGLSLDPQTGIISGTPTKTGTYNVTLGATNAAGTGTSNLVLTIAAPPPVISSAPSASGGVNAAFTYQITASNNPTSFSADGLPYGLTIDTQAGVISGTLTFVGNYTVTLGATNTMGTGNATLNLTINPTGAPVITSETYANSRLNTQFYYQITADNNPAGFSAAGLPPGLTIDTQAGVISGIPTAMGSYTVTLGASNVVGTGTSILTLNITLLDDATFVSQSVPSEMLVGQSYSVTVTLLNSGDTTWAPNAYQLVYVAPDPSQANCWNVTQVALPNSVTPQQTATFTFSVTAPAMPGHYQFCWSMYSLPSSPQIPLQFGDTTTEYTISVVDQPSIGGALQNPGFEQPALASAAYLANPSNASWNFSGTAGITSNASACTAVGINAPEGSQAAYIQDNGSLSQSTVNLVPGVYVVAFRASQGNYFDYQQQIAVSAGNTSLGLFAPTDSSYSFYTSAPFTVLATGPVSLSFAGIDPYGYGSTILIDDVRVFPLPTIGSTPYGGTPWTLPGRILAVNFDEGGQDVGFGDTTPYNEYKGSGGMPTYRDTAVDIMPSQEPSVAYSVGAVNPGEYLNYTVNVTAAGNYTVAVRAYQSSGAILRVEVDGVDVTGPLTVPGSSVTNIINVVPTTSFALAAGTHQVRLVSLNGGVNLGWVSFDHDANSNGLPDSWEMQYFGNLSHVNPDEDYDGDGWTNLQEYEFGTDPTDFYNGTVSSIAIVGGGDQRGSPGTVLPVPISVQVNANGSYGVPITLTVMRGGALLSATSTADPADPPATTITLPAAKNANNAGQSVYVARAYVFLPNTPNDVSKIQAQVQNAGPNGRSPSAVTSAIVTDDTLVPPTNLAVQLSTDRSSATLQWTVSDSTKATIIEASTDGGRTWFTVGIVAAGLNSATVTGLMSGSISKLIFRISTASASVTANSATGNTFPLLSGGNSTGGGSGNSGGATGSSPGQATPASPQPRLDPAAPLVLTVPDVTGNKPDPDYSTVRLDWTPDLDAQSFTVERCQDNGPWMQVCPSTRDVTYTDSGLKAGTVYRYRVSTADNYGMYSAPCYSGHYRVALVKNLSEKSASKVYAKSGFVAFIPSTPRKWYLQQTEWSSYDESRTGDYVYPDDHINGHGWEDGWLISKVNPLDGSTTYQGQGNYGSHGSERTTGTGFLSDISYYSYHVAKLPDGPWTGTYTSDIYSYSADLPGAETTHDHDAGTYDNAYTPFETWLVKPASPVWKDLDLGKTTQLAEHDVDVMTGSAHVSLDTEYTTDEFIKNSLDSLQNQSGSDWIDVYADSYDFTYAPADPDIQLLAGSRFLSDTEDILRLWQCQYRFTMRDAVPGTTLNWLEVFVPDAAPGKPEVLQSRSVAASVGQTASYTMDVTQPQKISDPKRSGSYYVCVPTVDIDINDTDDLSDDYVVMQKPVGSRPKPMHGTDLAPFLSTGTAGDFTNTVPMRVTFSGLIGLSAHVYVTAKSSGGGAVTVLQNGSPLPSTGLNLIAGRDGLDTAELSLQGTQASTSLGDVTITATTDLTGSAIIGKRSVTVLWIKQKFFGSDQPLGTALHSDNEAGIIYPIHTRFNTPALRIVGGVIHYTSPGLVRNSIADTFSNQMEIQATLSTNNEVVPDVKWQVLQEFTKATWGPDSSSNYLNIEQFNDDRPTIEEGWCFDGGEDPVTSKFNLEGFYHGDDADFVQEIDAPFLYAVDGPDSGDLLRYANTKYTTVEKFRTWWEVEISGKWYVCSEYMPWRAITHAQCVDPSAGWTIIGTPRRNEVLQGWLSPSMDGFSDKFPENP